MEWFSRSSPPFTWDWVAGTVQADPLYNFNSIYFMLIIRFNTIPVKDGIRRAADALDPCEGRHLSPDHG